MSVRKVSSRGGNMTGKFPSLKLRRMVAYESTIERDYLFLLDFEPEVVRFQEQPLTIEYKYEGKLLHYTPDFHVTYPPYAELVECKPSDLVDTEENQHKFDAARVWCAERGWKFVVMTDKDIRVGPRLANVRLLTRYARLTVGPNLLSRIYACLHESPVLLTLADVSRALAPDDASSVMAALLHLAFHHQIILPIADTPISGNASVRLPTAGEGERL